MVSLEEISQIINSKIRPLLQAHNGDIELLEIIYNRLDADLVIFLSGCSANCSWRYGETDSNRISDK